MTVSTMSFDGGSRKVVVTDVGIIFPLPQLFNVGGIPLYKAFRIDSKGAGRHVFIKYGTSALALVDLSAWQTLRALVTVIVVDDTATYTVNLDTVDYDYVAQGGDTATEIVDGLIAAIPAAFNAVNVNNELTIERVDLGVFAITVAATAAGQLLAEETLAKGNLIAANGYVEKDGISPTTTHIGLITPPGETAEVVVMAVVNQAVPQRSY